MTKDEELSRLRALVESWRPVVESARRWCSSRDRNPSGNVRDTIALVEAVDNLGRIK